MDGMLLRVSLKTGVDASQEGISYLILFTLCGINPNGTASVCANLWFYGLVFFLIGLVAMAENLSANPILYVMGFVLGIVLVG
ncbi:MAG: hypothetical protein WC717_06555 [Candidatus Micrarchaeia archaeon]|jgi:hypothetical protein